MILILLCLGTMPQVNGELIDCVDLLEASVVYDDQGREVLRQVIGWDWNSQRSRYDVVFWRLAKADMRIERSADPRKCQASWHDGDTLRIVKAPFLKESHLQYDPEMRERAVLPQNMRRGLTPAFDPRGSQQKEDDLVP